MGFKNFCCNCCGWFSVIGVFTFGVLAMMLFRRNLPVLQHKFHLKETDDEKIAERVLTMVLMMVIMLFSALVCFFFAIFFEK